MTREDILKMEAGPELDRIIAEKVMGINKEWKIGHGWQTFPDLYSTDISAAWQVAATLSQFAVKRMIGRWEVLCFDGITGHKASADTAPLAICRAALLAVESK